MTQFVTDLTAAHFDGLSQYGVARPTFQVSAVIDTAKWPTPNSQNPGKAFSEEQMQEQLMTWFTYDALTPKPAGDEVNLVYLIFAPSDTTLSLNGTTGGFCGYHSHGSYNGSGSRDNLIWGTVQGYSKPTGEGAGQAFVDSISYCVSHELAEAFSNPDGNGYYSDVNGCEIGDVCEAGSAGGLITVPYMNWRIETYWSNLDTRCISGYDEPEWIKGLYFDLLGRAPEPAGLDGWASQRKNNVSLNSVANGFLQSPEYSGDIAGGLYQKLLDRAPDPAGLLGWTQDLQNGVSLQQVILGYCDSAEYKANNPVPDQFVESLYTRLLGRASDPAGKQGWVAALTEGKTTGFVINGFLTSQEYCADRVTELYQSLLGRAPDPDGLAFWVGEMTGGAPFQQIQRGFLTSPEYRARALVRFRDDEVKWVEALYVDLFGRPFDASGLTYWVARKQAGVTLDDVAGGFLQSAEYCGDIARGLYQKLLDRTPDPAGLLGWTQDLQSGAALQQVILGFCDSAEYKTNNPVPDQFVESLYNRLLGRASDAAGRQGWVGALTGGKTTAFVINGFLTSQEYCSDRVTELYQPLLGRDPDQDGLDGWVGAMIGGAAFQQIQSGFLTSPEYRARALTRF
jgi:hypothetical protein